LALSNVQTSSYAGISGAITGLIPGFNETRAVFTNASACGTTNGGGVLFKNSEIGIKDITDGTSNTMVVSEQSNYMIGADGKNYFWNATEIFGWELGSYGEITTPPNITGSSIGVTTIAYPINDFNNLGAGWPVTCCGGSTVFNGDWNSQYSICSYGGINVPLNSAHPGGVMCLFADGSVHFVSQSTPLAVVAQLATRDDGVPLPNF
jgi:prepilin-type processing-associated H-X9-DG protein